uniref:DNA polymerase n=1 Tax=Termitomyces sp. Mi165-7 TaxID=2846912 RepID=A0A8F1ABW5_9AGAR|nr:DNA polymerase [Termitomyces sp. Mi165-7]
MEKNYKNIINKVLNTSNSELLKEGTWMYYEIPYKYSSITTLIIDLFLNSFKKDILDYLKENTTILIQFRIRNDDNTQFRSISIIERINKELFENLSDIYKGLWELKDNEYDSILSNPKMYLAYHIIPSEINYKLKKPEIKKSYLKSESINLKFKGYILPNTMDISLWGESIIEKDYSKAIILKRQSKAVYQVEIRNKNLNVKYLINNKVILTFSDYMDDKYNLSTFTRKIKYKNKEIIYKIMDGKIVFMSKLIEFKFMKGVSKESDYKNKFITMDFETRVIDDKMSIYCCSIFDGKNITSYYLNDFNNKEEMLREALKSLFLRKYRGYKVFLHNFSNFDVIFILNGLVDVAQDISFILNDNNFIYLILKFSENYNLNFRDSFLLLPSSLRNLARSFNVQAKGIFPYKFLINNNIPLNYIGQIPNYNYFSDISLEEYNLYCKSFKGQNWDLKKETIKYCEQDVVTLHSLIEKFNLLIFRNNRVNAIKYPTLSSLAMVIYRSNFFNENKYKIPKITGNVYDFIKKGYFGGAVDVYKPKLTKGNIYRYDINSLYPYVMFKFDMPVGNPKYFEGNIFDFEKDPFGFFEVEVETTTELKHPLLPYKGTKQNFRTIAPLGKWKGVYFSEEIKNSKKFGYKIKVLKGYTFERKNIFKEYVEYFYNLKTNTPKSDPLYTISKLFLNSLYGKFGMSPYKDNHKIVNINEFYEFMDQKDKEVLSFINLTDDKLFITYKNKISKDENLHSPNVNVAIAAAITAYARIHMSTFKNNPHFELYYSDTDSIDINRPLPENFVGKGLGQMKLEHIFKKAVYLAPKVYGGIETNNNEIIKIKGYKNKNLKYTELEPLLYKNENLLLSQDKWYKNIADSNITIKEEIYSLMVTGNKRKLIYNKDNYLVETKPFWIDDSEIK